MLTTRLLGTSTTMHYNAILITLVFLPCCSTQDGYYWRDYMGWVPEDTIVAGLDTFGNKIYVGQAYMRFSGLLVGRLFPRETYLFGTYNGIVLVGKYIKALCGPPEKFYWMKTHFRNFKSQVRGKQPVIGGHEDKNGYLNIGRVYKNGEFKIGKVTSFWNNEAHLYYADNGQEFKAETYELLMYNITE